MFLKCKQKRLHNNAVPTAFASQMNDCAETESDKRNESLSANSDLNDTAMYNGSMLDDNVVPCTIDHLNTITPVRHRVHICSAPVTSILRKRSFVESTTQVSPALYHAAKRDTTIQVAASLSFCTPRRRYSGAS
jgi:hypothetical protein